MTTEKQEVEEDGRSGTLLEPLLGSKESPPGDSPHLRQITRKLCLLYFLVGLSGASWGRLSTIYYNDEKHLSPSQIGIIEGCMPAARMISAPLWGATVDAFQCPKRVALVTQSINTVVLLLLAIPSIATGFSPVLAISVILSLFVAPSILDSYTLDVVGSENRSRYGRIRLWTSVSYGTGSFAVGAITDTYGFDWAFVLFGAFSLMTILAVQVAIPDTKRADKLDTTTTAVVPSVNPSSSPSSPPPDPSNGEVSTPPKKSTVLSQLQRPAVFLFLFEVVVFGAGIAVVERLLFVYLQNELDASTTLCGATVLCTTITCWPLFWHADKVHSLLGHDGSFLGAMAAYAARVYGYTRLTKGTVWWVLALEPLHGVTWGLMWNAAVSHTRLLSPHHIRNTLMSVMNACYWCVGVGVGAVVGGHVMEDKGGVFLYRTAAEVMGSLFVCHLLYVVVCCGQQRCRRTTET